MEVAVALMSLSQPSPIWRERFRAMYLVGVYPTVNPDWGSLKREVSTRRRALDIAEEMCADIENPPPTVLEIRWKRLQVV